MLAWSRCDREVAMLVIISDLHLTDGTSGHSISSGAFEIFAEAITDLARCASHRAGGTYRPVDRVDLVLLGDVLDVIRSTRWLQGVAVRPWTNLETPEAIAFIDRATDDILTNNEPAMRILRSMAEAGITVPAANRAGKPGGGEVAVPVRIHYLVGNHDWMYHKRSSHYHPIRQKIVQRMGLANRHDAPFPHDPAESAELIETMRRHKVFARHGDVFDPFNFMGDREMSSLGDAIVIELLSRFSAQVEAELANDLPTATLVGLRELDNIRPLILAPVWIDGLLERTCPFPAVRTQIKRVWDRLADEFLQLPFVREQDTWSPADLVDGLQTALKFSKVFSIARASAVVEWWQRIRGSSDASYYAHALTEQDFRNRRARHIVYGHTHFAESVPLDASFAEGFVLNQMYFNSGTWRRVHRQTRLAPAEHEFIASECMTYLAFFQADERAGRPFETWSGMLGINPAEVNVHRIDSGHQPDAARQPLSSPGIPGHGPHFSTQPARTRLVPGNRFA